MCYSKGMQDNQIVDKSTTKKSFIITMAVSVGLIAVSLTVLILLLVFSSGEFFDEFFWVRWFAILPVIIITFSIIVGYLAVEKVIKNKGFKKL